MKVGFGAGKKKKKAGKKGAGKKKAAKGAGGDDVMADAPAAKVQRKGQGDAAAGGGEAMDHSGDEGSGSEGAGGAGGAPGSARERQRARMALKQNLKVKVAGLKARRSGPRGAGTMAAGAGGAG
jgi:hypothetical protein